MRLAKRIGRFGFVLGFVGPVLFDASPPFFPTYESRIACPLCPYVDVAFGHPLLWLEIGLRVGLLQGIAFALIGFAIGCAVSRTAPSWRWKVETGTWVARSHQSMSVGQAL